MATKRSSIRKQSVIYKVSGKVFNTNNEPIDRQAVIAFDVDLVGAAVYNTAKTVRELQASKGFEFLGKATTNGDGYYEIIFKSEMFRRHEIGKADVVVFAIEENTITGRSRLSSEKNYFNTELRQWDVYL